MMTEKRFTDVWCSETGYIGITDNGIDKEFTGTEFKNWLNELAEKGEQLKQQLSDIDGQLVMLDNCDNWDYDRMKHTVREIAEIIGYNGTINPKR